MAKKKKCYSIRLKEFVQISEKAYRAIAYDGTSTIIPASQYFGEDTETTKSKGYWITEWILKKKNIQHKLHDPKIAWFDNDGNKYSTPERDRRPRRTRFTVTYKKKDDSKVYICKTVAESKDFAETSMIAKFRSGKLEFKPIEDNKKIELEIVSIE